MKLRNYIKENRLFVLTLLVTTLIYFTGAYLVLNDSISNRENSAHLETENQASHYNLVLHDALYNVYIIETFVDTIGIDSITEETFHDFIDTDILSNMDYVSISIAPEGIIEFYHSDTEGDGLIGYDLLNDERDYVREAIEYAIENKAIIVNGPFDLIQGDKGIVFRKPIFENEEFVGLINYVVDYNALNDAFNSHNHITIETTVYDEFNEIVFGDVPFTDKIHYTEDIELEYVNWKIGIQVSETYERQEAITSSLIGTGFTLLYIVIMFFWIRYYTKNRQLIKTQDNLIKYDNLTSLPNRRMFHEETLQLIKSNKEFYLGFGDLDNFKNINDVLGHSIGDQYLSFVSEQFKELITNNFRVYRWGGDEFIFVIIQSNKDKIRPLLDEVFDVFKTPFDINGSKHQISISIGVVNYPKDGRTIDELVKHADIVMYDIKAQYKNTYSFFEEKYMNKLYEELEFQQKLDEFQIEDFEVYFQPIINVKTSEVCGLEGLSRLFDKDGTQLSTFNIIKQYEQDGTITTLDKYVFNEICKSINRLKKECQKEFFVTFNISPLSLNTDYIEYLQRTVRSHKINPEGITIEIIETLGFKDVRISVDLLNQIKKLGFKIAMDDFGMGYSSLSYIAKLPLDIIKIDRTFIHTYKTNKFNRIILKTIKDISDSLHLETLVEGIETKEQLEYIKQLGSTYYQGYYHSKPMSLTDVIQLMKQNKKTQ